MLKHPNFWHLYLKDVAHSAQHTTAYDGATNPVAVEECLHKHAPASRILRHAPLPPPPTPKKIRCPGIGFEAISGSDLIGHQQTGQICSGLLYTSTGNSAKSCFIKFCVASNTVAIPVCENQLCYYVSSITAPQESQCGQECEEVLHYSLQN